MGNNYQNNGSGPGRCPWEGGYIFDVAFRDRMGQARKLLADDNRVAMQERYMDEIWHKFDGQVRAILPLYDSEVRGLEKMKRMTNKLFED